MRWCVSIRLRGPKILALISMSMLFWGIGATASNASTVSVQPVAIHQVAVPYGVGGGGWPACGPASDGEVRYDPTVGQYFRCSYRNGKWGWKKSIYAET